MHIVQVLAALGIGGSELVATELTEYLRRRGHRLTVIAASGPLSERISAAGAEHLHWPIGKKRLSTLKLVKPLRAWLEQARPDIIHVHSRFPALIVKLAMRGLRHRPLLISSMHGHYSVNAYSGIMARADVVIAVSEHIRQYTLRHYPGVDPQRVITVHGGVDHSQFAHGHQPSAHWLCEIHAQFPALHNKRLLLLPGRLTQWKGHASFLQLLKLLSTQRQDVHGVVVGAGRRHSRYRQRLDSLLRRLQIEQLVTFTGARTDMADWYAAADIVYNLSDRPPEAFGRTVLEALSIGTPVLAWDQGGPAEQLQALFPAGRVAVHDMSALLQKTLDLLHHPQLVPASDAFSLAQSMASTLAIYEQALAQRHAH
ncbi:MAG: glycosyltransferase [Gammaproteobacteria bacterium]|nr:glycosyltransferase [Gammaproteobacteria bacterium]